MDNERFQGRTIMASVLFGIALGSAFTFVGLKASGVAIEPHTNTPPFQKLYAVYHDLHDKYYRAVPEDTLLTGAIQGMVKSVNDQFTDYFTPSAANQFQNMLTSSFVGIGVMLQHVGNQFEIVSVNDNSPAQKAGLRAHDVIEAVDGHSIAGMSFDKVTSLIVGREGTRVVLTIHRPSLAKALKIQVTRAKITEPTVQLKMLPGHVGYLKITIVAEHTAAEVQKALSDFRTKHGAGIILDLRDNVGGYLGQATQIANDFVPKGKVVVSTEDRAGNRQVTKSDGPGLKVPVVVLINDNTASAAEILSAALNEDTGAPLIGTRSFGKGTAQETEFYHDGSALKYTVAKWLTPNGNWIHEKGLKPTYSVQLPWFFNLSAVSDGSLPLHNGVVSGDVKNLQGVLLALGYSVRQTGHFDDATSVAVKVLQSKASIPVSGTVDAETAQTIDQQLALRVKNSDTQLRMAQKILSERVAGKTLG